MLVFVCANPFPSKPSKQKHVSSTTPVMKDEVRIGNFSHHSTCVATEQADQAGFQPGATPGGGVAVPGAAAGGNMT